MIHYVAIQDTEGRWHYANEGRHRETGAYGWNPAGACSPWQICDACREHPMLSAEQKSCSVCGGRGLVKKESTCGGHATEAEAYEHERQRVLDSCLRFWEDSPRANTQNRCRAEGCGAFTSGGGHAKAYHTFSLCAEHRNRETMDRLVCVGESWES